MVASSSSGGYSARLDTSLLAAKTAASTDINAARREAPGQGPTQGQGATTYVAAGTSTDGYASRPADTNGDASEDKNAIGS